MRVHMTKLRIVGDALGENWSKDGVGGDSIRALKKAMTTAFVCVQAREPTHDRRPLLPDRSGKRVERLAVLLHDHSPGAVQETRRVPLVL